MLEAVAARDADRAEKLGRAHTILFRSRINEYLNEDGAVDLEVLPL